MPSITRNLNIIARCGNQFRSALLADTGTSAVQAPYLLHICASPGMSQEQLAHRAGLSMRFISLLEGSRHRPTLVTMHKIAEALDLPLSEMIRQAEALPRR